MDARPTERRSASKRPPLGKRHQSAPSISRQSQSSLQQATFADATELPCEPRPRNNSSLQSANHKDSLKKPTRGRFSLPIQRDGATPGYHGKAMSNNFHGQLTAIFDSDSDVENDAKISAKYLTRLKTTNLDDDSIISPRPYTPVSDEGVDLAKSDSLDQEKQSGVPPTPESYSNSILRRPGTADSQARHTFFYGVEDDSPIDQVRFDERLKLQDSMITDTGMMFSDLVDRLLQLPKSKIDAKFVPSFLCLYRAFATPMLLLVEIMDRFIRTDKSTKKTQSDKMVELLRYLQVMATWSATYPGDFADRAVRELASTFVHDIQKSKNLAPAAKEISSNLLINVRDEDEDWAYNDVPQQQKKHEKTASIALLSKEAWLIDTEENENSDLDSGTSESRSRTASIASSLRKPNSLASQSAANLASFRNACDQARRLAPYPHVNLSKVQWHLFMDTPADELARELTRIDWIRYAAIRPRDFVREVSLSDDQRKTSNIALMIRHFNHISYFVAGMILLRDKPKHRAKAAEKVMELAWKVRQLNNYNCVNAIVAGMQNTAITRLSQTMELVPPETQRQFMRLNVLVDATKSYATYRIAWENTFSERIPLVPSILKDLKIAMLANQTFIGDKICWRKFEIMGDAIISIQKSQEVSYTFPERSQRSDDIMKLFLETKVVEITDDSVDPSKELYDRSKRIEPQLGVSDMRKKFDWLRR